MTRDIVITPLIGPDFVAISATSPTEITPRFPIHANHALLIFANHVNQNMITMSFSQRLRLVGATSMVWHSKHLKREDDKIRSSKVVSSA